ncbi:MAG TPA: hypothetical protein VLB74_00325 [Flavobacterium sp.]|uniref:hypothetical protein n=1 Tax=Flavobacterium sp. TaxID=239 RepID=UPI002CD6CC96|nr:hypothetical protein [Flavobacterium sp.]HSD13070.1 hypothetical protein [Flavobacterium sp.]
MEYNYQTASFSEMISETSITTIAPNFDIIIDQNKTLQTYCDALMRKVFELPHTDYPAFISYQANLVKEPTLWLNHFEELISNNEDQFTGKKSLCRYHKLLNQIEFRRKELQSTSVKESKGNIPKKYINAENEDRHFSFYELKKQLNDTPCEKERIILLTKEQYEYQQTNIDFINQKLPLYDQQCVKEIEQIYAIRKLKAELGTAILETNPNQLPYNKLKVNCNVNQFVDIFYQLHRELFANGNPIIDGNVNDMVSMIVNSFTDKEGNEISPQTVETILKPSRTDKRPKPHKRIDIDKML